MPWGDGTGYSCEDTRARPAGGRQGRRHRPARRRRTRLVTTKRRIREPRTWNHALTDILVVGADYVVAAQADLDLIIGIQFLAAFRTDPAVERLLRAAAR